LVSSTVVNASREKLVFQAFAFTNSQLGAASYATATEKQIRKRFRDLSLKYHPDKTGNDPVKKEFFMKLQSAMEVITKGTFDGPSNENAMRERLSVGL
jgi:hypothetical protein